MQTCTWYSLDGWLPYVLNGRDWWMDPSAILHLMSNPGLLLFSKHTSVWSGQQICRNPPILSWWKIQKLGYIEKLKVRSKITMETWLFCFEFRLCLCVSHTSVLNACQYYKEGRHSATFSKIINKNPKSKIFIKKFTILANTYKR